MKAKKYVAGRELAFKSVSEEGNVEVVTLEPGDAIIVQPKAYDVQDMPTTADVLEVAPEVTPPVEVAPEVAPAIEPALTSRRAPVARRPVVASAARGSIRQRLLDFRASAMQGSVMAKK